MASKLPAFRTKFPLLFTGGLLLLQPVSSISAAEQFNCQPGPTGAWACSPKAAPAVQPPRPQHSESAVSAATPEELQTGDRTTSRRAARPSEDFSRLDWVPRDQLTPAQLAEAGPYCAGAYIEPTRPGMNDNTPMSQAPTYLSAKASRYQQEEQIATLAGDVVMRQSSLQVEADEANLHQLDNRGELQGNVKLRDKGFLVLGDRAQIKLDSGEAEVDNAEYVMHDAHARGSASYAKREVTSIVRLKDGTYTRCEPGDNAWQLKGNNVTLNPATGFGTATNVTLRVKNVPIFYTPYIYFPIDDRRQSGFLPPSFSTASKTGFSIVTPYYINLAPNYDATIYPRYMAKRGLLMEGEFRYLTRNSEGQVGGAFLRDKDDDRKLQSDYRDDRWMVNVQNRTGFDSRLMAEVDYTDVSDPYYFQDLTSQMDIDGQRREFLNQRGTLTYRGDSYTARFNAHAYERATVVNITPYDRLPQITLDGQLPFEPGGLNFAYSTEAVRFERSLRNGNFINEDGIPEQWYDDRLQGLARAEGDRLHVEPSVSLPLDWTWGYVKPTAKYLQTNYDLDLDSAGRSTLAETGETYNSSVSRGVGLFSLDSGLYFDRQTSLFGTQARQTLEPRLFYLHVPNKDQSDIPVFDTSEYTFSYASLFRENRFTGRDRIGDANQVSLGVTSRWIEDNGFERQRLSVGQAYYFRDREVQMPLINYRERQDATSSVSPYALEYMYRFNRDWRLNADYNWDPDSHETRSGSLMFHYQPESDPRKIVNVGYRYRNDTMRFDQATGRWTYGSDYGTAGTPEYIKDYYKIQQHDLSVIWPIVPQWSVVARWQFDYNRSRTLEAFGGFEYDSCCWKLRLINRYWVDYDETSLNPSRNEDPDRGIFLQIVLKGLGGIFGNKTEGFLDQGIQGFREREDQAM
ncbi:LPS-assembly protein LptD [Pseudomonas sp. Marseille-QA0892]